jgi:hypothetical protein
MLHPRCIPHDPVFRGLFSLILSFIDEEWFNITRRMEMYYITPNEEQLRRTCRKKNFIPKIMILCALVHPRFDSWGTELLMAKLDAFHL